MKNRNFTIYVDIQLEANQAILKII